MDSQINVKNDRIHTYWYLYIYICTCICRYFLISSLSLLFVHTYDKENMFACLLFALCLVWLVVVVVVVWKATLTFKCPWMCTVQICTCPLACSLYLFLAFTNESIARWHLANTISALNLRLALVKANTGDHDAHLTLESPNIWLLREWTSASTTFSIFYNWLTEFQLVFFYPRNSPVSTCI